jgi:hypothetical protein
LVYYFDVGIGYLLPNINHVEVFKEKNSKIYYTKNDDIQSCELHFESLEESTILLNQKNVYYIGNFVACDVIFHSCLEDLCDEAKWLK